MHFEHLIEINDPMNPLIDLLTRQQLWVGLVLRAESPKLFIPHLDECELEVAPNSVIRRLRYGELIVQDQVFFHPQERIVYEVAAQKDIVPSRLCMRIEEPSPQHLYVRFEYSDSQAQAQDAANKMYDDFRRSAYTQADIDTISIIRRLAEQGQLNLC
jgi:hypothetical protein